MVTHLLTILDTSNVAEQFTIIGCQEVTHTFRAALALRRLHGKDIFTLFDDLIKACYMVNNDLLFKILKNTTSRPESLMYSDEYMRTVISAGKWKGLIDYLTGAQQGDNVAPVLFLFLVLAVSQTLKEKWNFTTPDYGHFEGNKWG
jgi:hypothetical protein